MSSEHDLKLGRYEVVRELGKGAMGVVYLARDPVIGRMVAIKTIRVGPSLDDDETREFQQRFTREAQAAGILSHPSIVTVHDIGQSEESNLSFIAMEYVEGRNLKEILSAGEALSFQRVVEIIASIADALDYAHARGVIHRDIKPANIILCDDGRAKITDFGIAKIAGGAANLTTTGQFLGTPNYMSPEQIRGGKVDGRSDLFSLGIVLYECLARRKPFAGDSLTSISYKIVHEEQPPLSQINPDIPPGFDVVISRCLAKTPGRRYQTGGELAEALRSVDLALRRVNDEREAGDATYPLRSENDRVRTVEVPFPDAEEVAPVAAAAREAEGSSRRSRPVRPAAEPGDWRAVLKREISPLLFIGVSAAVLISFMVTIAILHASKEEVPVVDTEREELVARQRELRLEAAAELRSGNTEAAYQTLQLLRRIAPNSPYVAEVLTRLEYTRFQKLTHRQRIARALERIEEGKKLFDSGDFAGAIPLFEEAVSLDPTSTEAANLLEASRAEQEKSPQSRRGSRNATSSSSRDRSPAARAS